MIKVGTNGLIRVFSHLKSHPSAFRHYLARRITDTHLKRIPFAEFMAEALYAPKTADCPGGYYTSHATLNGNTLLDFTTNPERFSPHYGAGIAMKLAYLWKEMGYPKKFDLILMGEGTGVLARDILDTLKRDYCGLYSCTKTKIVEISPMLVNIQKQKLWAHPQVEWLNMSAVDGNLPEINGVVLSNELPDAFPVHLVCMQGNTLGEIWVECRLSANEPRFAEVFVAGVSDDISKYLEDSNTKIPICREKIPINLNAVRWMKNVTRAIKRGFHLVIDYGFNSKVSLPESLIWTMSKGRRDYIYLLADPGEQDITTLVDFGMLINSGEREGAVTLLDDTEVHLFYGTNFPQMHRLGSDPFAGFRVLVQSKGLSDVNPNLFTSR